jgi:hypothetical protein
MFPRFTLAIGLFLLSFGIEPAVASAQTGWVPYVVAPGPMREQIQALPIEQRPNRPLHFYGNAVRRNYYRSQGVPTSPFLPSVIGLPPPAPAYGVWYYPSF